DPALGLLGAHARRRRPGLETIWWPIGNGAALAQFEAGQAHAALVHAPEGGPAPAPAVPARRLRLAARPIGLMVAAGNPKAIRSVHDLARPGVRLVNREPGSGARSLLDERLAAAAVKAERVAGYARVLAGHADVARAIAWGLADAGIGIAGAAAEMGLEFIPLAVEWCDLWLALEAVDDPLLQPLLDSAVADAFRLDLSALGDYATQATGAWVE
ncbi:MAG TPA: substrate-binding domain-containing protein, partial [Limnochordia bacterium]|nr:substrate-binding domain-containing protein [Limnochordia bacterium]